MPLNFGTTDNGLVLFGRMIEHAFTRIARVIGHFQIGAFPFHELTGMSERVIVDVNGGFQTGALCQVPTFHAVTGSHAHERNGCLDSRFATRTGQVQQVAGREFGHGESNAMEREDENEEDGLLLVTVND